MDPQDAGRTIGDRYRLDALLDAAEDETIYLGRDLASDRPARIRRLRRSLADERPDAHRDLAARYEREYQATHDLESPHVLSARALLRDTDGDLYLVTEHAEGQTLREALAAQGALTPESTLAFAVDICRAIADLYARGVVHRDIKPAHVLLGADGVARLTGLGAAQLPSDADRTQAAAGHPGTPAYKSPEQATSTGYLDERSDLYALALVMYEALTGRPYVLDRRPPRAHATGVPASLEAVILKGLEPEPERRYRTAEAFRQDLLQVRAESVWGQLGILARRVRLASVAGAAGMLVVLLLAASLWRLGSALSAQPPPAAGPPAVMAQAPAPPQATAGPEVGLAAAAGATFGDDAFEPDDIEPAPLSVGESQPRVFAPERDVDRAVLRVKAGVTYVVRTEDLAVGVDPRLEVLVGGRTLANDDATPGALGAEVLFTAETDGVAVITVSNQDAYGPERTYRLSVSTIAPTPTPTPTATLRPSPEASVTPRPTYTPATPRTSTPRPTIGSPTPTLTRTPTLSPTPTLTRTPTITRTPTMTRTPVASPTPSNTPEPTHTPTPDRTPLPVRTEGPPSQ